MTQNIRYKIPPCPGNPEDYELVMPDKMQPYWRRKPQRKLNSTFKNNAEKIEKFSPFTSVLLNVHAVAMQGLVTTGLQKGIISLLSNHQNQYGVPNLSALKGMDFQEWKLETAKPGNIETSVNIEEGRYEVKLGPYILEYPNKSTTRNYRFGLVLAYQPRKTGKSMASPRLEMEFTDWYPVTDGQETCAISIPFHPDTYQWWMISLRLEFGSESMDEAKLRNVRMRVLDGDGMASE